MTLAFDAAGPSSAGAAGSSAAPSWTHVVTGTSNLLLAAIACDNDSATVTSITYGGAAMTPLFSGSANYKHSNGMTAGWIAVFKLAGAAAGSASVTAALSASSAWEAGSLSFSGADTATGIGTPQFATGAGTPATMSFTPDTSGNLIAAFLVNGLFINSATSPLTSRFINNTGGSNAGGNIAGATAPATGSAVTTAWTVNADWYAIVTAEVLPFGAIGTGPAVLASGTGAAQAATTSPYSLTSGTLHAAAAADLGGGYGSWATPQYAEGGP
ncbi:MAG TPA: hypothetical protein VFQ68_03485 [Streptosporangiaceae bacterium]|nr:hypothetical protein [Streptosporangiaceae bacterium]